MDDLQSTQSLIVEEYTLASHLKAHMPVGGFGVGDKYITWYEHLFRVLTNCSSILFMPAGNICVIPDICKKCS